MDIKVGDVIGGLYKNTKLDGTEYWELVETKISKIVSNRNGTKVYSKRLYPLDIEEIKDGTNVMKESLGQNWINTRDVVLLTDDLRDKCERWVEWANKNPDKVGGVV